VTTTQMVLAAISKSCFVTRFPPCPPGTGPTKKPAGLESPTGFNARSCATAVRRRPVGSVAHGPDGRKPVFRFFAGAI
jgi:hypothetical protein